MNNRPGVRETLGLLERLQATVREFASREADLNTDFRARLSRESQKHQIRMEVERDTSTRAAREADDAFHFAQKAVQEKAAKRAAWIDEARGTSKDQQMRRIDDRTGARKYDLQKRMLQAERNRDATLTEAAGNLAQFKASLKAEQERLEGLEQVSQKAFSGYGKLLVLVPGPETVAALENQDEHSLLSRLQDLLGKTEAETLRFSGKVVIKLFKALGLWLFLAALPLLVAAGGPALGLKLAFSMQQGLYLTGGGEGLLLVWYILVRLSTRAPATAIGSALGLAEWLAGRALEAAVAHHKRDVEQARSDFKHLAETIDVELKTALDTAVELRVSARMTADKKSIRAAQTNEALRKTRLARLEQVHQERAESLKRGAVARVQEVDEELKEKQDRLNAEWRERWATLESEWKTRIQAIYEWVNAANTEALKLFPGWESGAFEKWKPPGGFAGVVEFGHWEVDVPTLAGSLPLDRKLALPGPAHFKLPLLLNYPQSGSLLLETPGAGRELMVGCLNNLMMRLLSIAPPGRAQFTIIDPVGLGQNFAGVMHLADHEEQLINYRIWTQTNQIEEKLAELNEHMEKVIQMYLRNEYASIADYNEQAGDIAEKYHFVVVADFPAGFSETAARRLLNIAASGARCGVYTLIHWDHRQPQPMDFLPEELRKSGVSLTLKGDEFVVSGHPLPGARIRLESPPPPEFATRFIHEVGRLSRDSSRVEVPFSQVVPPDAALWSEETTQELRVPIGRTGATKLQYLTLGKGTRQHALIAGKTGSGKSTLFHVIITNLALWCSPEQVEFYLVDFKKGVEFKCYGTKRLPHARVVAIESDREFGLSVLQRVDEELKRRGELFRKLGVQDVPGYKRAGGTESIPRSLLMIDEFQEFFVEDDKISQTASILLDRIVRQGRAFGIHVILGSQTLGGAYTVARTTLGQMVIRIALQCNEADAYLIMDDSNPAPRLLSRPGEGIYNDEAGALQGNSPFQTVWLADETRDHYLDKVNQRARQTGTVYPGPIVFEGDAPAEIRENPLLTRLLHADAIRASGVPRIWLGAPNSIKGPTEAIFQQQSGNNLLLVGQRDDATLAILSLALVSLAAQFPPGSARFFLFHGAPPGSPPREYLEGILHNIPVPIVVPHGHELADTLSGIVDDLKQRSSQEQSLVAPRTFLIFHGLQRYTKLRYEEDFGFSSGDAEGKPNPSALLNQIICEGATHGIHVIASCDTYNNVNRFLSKKAFSEFEMRVVFQMSANDSASLIDSPKANNLGLHRALFYNEQEGYLEVFRPYALPDMAWIEEAGKNLQRLLTPGEQSRVP